MTATAFYKVELDLTTSTQDDWLAARMTGLTGSDALAALGLDPYKSRFALWLEKRSGVRDNDDNERTLAGRILEPAVKQLFTAKTGRKVRDLNVLARSIEHPFMLATPDGEVVDDDNAGYEGKTTTVWLRDDWANDEVPLRALAQGAHYMAVLGWQRVYFAALIDNLVHVRVVERDDTFIAQLIEREREFWQMVVDGTPPPVDHHQSTTNALAEMYPEHVEGKSIELAEDLIDAWRDAKTELALAEMRVEALSNRIRNELGDAEIGTVNGDKAVSWKAQTRRQVDVKALRDAHPAIAEEFTVTSQTRVLRDARRRKKGEGQ